MIDLISFALGFAVAALIAAIFISTLNERQNNILKRFFDIIERQNTFMERVVDDLKDKVGESK